MKKVGIEEALEEFDSFSLEDKEFLVEVLMKRLTEEKREKLVVRAEEAMEKVRKNMTKKGNLQDFYQDMESD